MSAIMVTDGSFRSPNFFYGVWGHTYKYGVAEKNEEVVIPIREERIPCKYQSEDEILEILRKQYERVCKNNTGRVYPPFEECIHRKTDFPLVIDGPLGNISEKQSDVVRVYLSMRPIS